MDERHDPEALLKSGIKASRIKPLGRSYTYARNKETGENERVYADGKRESLEEPVSLSQSIFDSPVLNPPQRGPSGSIDKNQLFNDIVARYQRKIDRLLNLSDIFWKRTFTRIKPKEADFPGLRRIVYLGKFAAFRWDVFCHKRKLRRNGYELKQIDELLFMNFPEEKARNEELRRRMVRM